MGLCVRPSVVGCWGEVSRSSSDEACSYYPAHRTRLCCIVPTCLRGGRIVVASNCGSFSLPRFRHLGFRWRTSRLEQNNLYYHDAVKPLVPLRAMNRAFICNGQVQSKHRFNHVSTMIFYPSHLPDYICRCPHMYQLSFEMTKSTFHLPR